jgi:hypothetical protein
VHAKATWAVDRKLDEPQNKNTVTIEILVPTTVLAATLIVLMSLRLT